MPEWAGWTLFIMVLYIMLSHRDYSGVIGNLSNKVDELEDKINELESTIEDLEGDIDTLESNNDTDSEYE